MKQWLNKARKGLSRFFLVAVLKAIGGTAHLLPYRVALKAGVGAGKLAFYLLPRERRRALAHLTESFPERDARWVQATARRTFTHLGKALFEVILMNPSRSKALVTFEGLENLESALAFGKGVIYVTGHIGNWELMAGTVSQIAPVTGIGAPLEPEELNKMIVGLRSKMGATMIVRGRPGATRELIRVFRENRVLGILMDQDTDVEGAFVDFFGRPAWTPTAAAQMANKFGAPVVFGYTHRCSENRHRIIIEGPLSLSKTGNDDEDARVNTALFTKLLEQAILKQPEQWVWMHRRWRRKP